ncbi:hypothetical protein B0H19DRAFT_1271984 [Mycena capillaripes]|nr:hypothetical protein B0H19DRAFT_1271984 [Mycena capillaripes]
MPALPPELIDGTICVLDIPTLRACALAGSLTRAPSQRILLRSLSLRVENETLSRPIRRAGLLENLIGALQLLQKSPQIAHYITQMKMQVLNVTILSMTYISLDALKHLLKPWFSNRALKARGEAALLPPV